MDHAKLMSHVDTDLVTRNQLRMIASPEATATFHPVPHSDLVEQLDCGLTDGAAKAFIHDAFVAGVMPVRFLPEVSQAYFQPDRPEFEPRTAWSLHNAFTGVAKAMPMPTRLPAIQELGRLFGMSADSPSPKLLVP